MDELLPVERFRDWLSSFGPNPCGEPHDPETCPVARWVRARLWPRARVAHGKLRTQPGALWEFLPEWGCRFESACLDAYEPGESIPAPRALAILERVLAGMQKEPVNA